MFIGYTVKLDFLKKLIWICMNYYFKFLYVDIVRVFYFGVNFLVEVDIVLFEDMIFKEVYDIGEFL